MRSCRSARTLLLMGVAVAVVGATAGSASGIVYLPYPTSTQPQWIAPDLIRFQSNLDTPASPRSYVVSPDGTGLRAATADEASAPVVPAPDSVSFDSPFAIGPLKVGEHVVESVAWATAGAALSPDGRTVVFAQWVGWAYSDGFTLYAVPVDGSAQPRRITPDSCTLSDTHSALTGRCIDGTDADDVLVGTKGGDIIIAGSGSDHIRAGDGQNEIQAQWGNDDIRTGSGPDGVWGGDGNDTIRTGAGGDRIDPGPGVDIVDAGSGADHIVSNDGQRDVIDCGSGDDSARVDRRDLVRHCEHVTVAPPQSRPAFQ